MKNLKNILKSLFSSGDQPKNQKVRPEPGCAVCYKYPESSFDIGPELMSTLVFKEVINGETLETCSKCGALFLEQRFVTEKDLIFEDNWRKLTTNFPENIQVATDKIGASIHSNFNQNNLAVPCQLHLKNGEIIDFGLIVFSSRPPTSYLGHYNIIGIDDLESISESKYALTLVARIFAKESVEVAMAFAPAILLNKAGEKIVVNGQTFFVKSDNVIGSELSPADETWSREKDKTEKFYYQDQSIIKETIIFVKTDKN